MKKVTYTLALAVAVLPGVAHAQQNNDVFDIIALIQNIIDFIVPLLIAVAVVVILWGVVQFIINQGNEDKREEGKSKIIWGIVGLFVMVSIWGLVNLLVNTLDLDTRAPNVDVVGDIPVSLNNCPSDFPIYNPVSDTCVQTCPSGYSVNARDICIDN